jgi:UDP-glucose 4-epimerase
MRSVVTGYAGFVGSHLSERLLASGHAVVGIDSFTNHYRRRDKLRNVARAVELPNFTFWEADLLSAPLEAVLDGAEVVFHLAAQAGVRSSWGCEFDTYTQNNILATQRLLESCRDRSHLRRVVYASSSSVYGNACTLPLHESATPHPISPYGVTKLAAEHLCSLYHVNFGVPTVSLRYFTVYGARQRPDMAFHRFIRAAFAGEPLTVKEDGQQTRDFTHVSDIVIANILAAERPEAVGNVYNVAGGSRVMLRHVLELIGKLTDRKLRISYAPKQAGDVRDTYADISAAQRDLDYAPSLTLEDGLRDEVTWLRQVLVGSRALRVEAA